MSPAGPTRSRAGSVELLIETLGAQGDGIAAWQDERVFVPFTVPGDRVHAQLGPRRGSGREARAHEWLAIGPGRATPPCRHFGRCGGCALQHLDAAAYRRAKLAGLFGALDRVGLDTAVVEKLRRVEGGRRRARLGLFRPADFARPAIVGFRERFSHRLVDLHDCAVLEPALYVLVDPLRQVAGVVVPPGSGVEAMLTRTDSGIDVLIEAETQPGLGAVDRLAEFAEARDLARITWRGSAGDIPIVERRPVRVVLSGVPVAFPPGAFLQASEAAEATLVSEVVAALGAERPVLDLYAGLGTFAFAVASGGPVHAVEGDAASAAALARAAAEVPQVSVERRDLERNPLPEEALRGYAAAVFDPPRAGALRQAAALAAAPIATVVAVSCNPATFARDAALLVAGGFRLERIVPVDQFAWTPHLEIVAVFRR